MRALRFVFVFNLLIGSIAMLSPIPAASQTLDLSRPTAMDFKATSKIQTAPLQATADGRGNYICNLKVYMVEKESRWLDYTNYYHYDQGFLAFAFDTILSLAYNETFQQTKIWDARAAGWASTADSTYVRENNMMAIAVLFNSENAGTNYSDPYFDDPNGAPFTVHFADACASATSGSPGYDTAYGLSTHTVFIEEGTEHT